MANSSTSDIYIRVMEDVINKVRNNFINNDGPGEAVLNQLQSLWEQKMIKAGVISGPVNRSVPRNPVDDLNVPYQGTEEYETPTAEMLFPPTPLPGTDGSFFYNVPTGGTPMAPNEYSPAVETGGVSGAGVGRGMPSPFMQQSPATWLNQGAPLDVNDAYTEVREEGERGPTNQLTTQDFLTLPAGKRKREDFLTPYQAGRYNIPQQDGAGGFQMEMFKADTTLLYGKVEGSGQVGKSSSSGIQQLDGPAPGPYDDEHSAPNMIYNYQGGANEDYNAVHSPMPNELQAPTPAHVPLPTDTGGDDDDDDDEPLNEDDDDDDLDDVKDDQYLNTSHLILAQFDKVSRTKSKWKCSLKNGIMHIHNKDIVFNKATGEFDF